MSVFGARGHRVRSPPPLKGGGDPHPGVAPAATSNDGGAAGAAPRPRRAPAAGEVDSLDCSFFDVWIVAWHDGLMLENKQLAVAIARHVFPGMGPFSEGLAKLGPWDVYLVEGNGVAWLTVQLGLDVLFRIEVRGGYVEARYALPAVIELGSGERRYGTAWANSRRWHVKGWSDVLRYRTEIKEFFNNIDEFLEEEANVYKILEGPND